MTPAADEAPEIAAAEEALAALKAHVRATRRELEQLRGQQAARARGREPLEQLVLPNVDTGATASSDPRVLVEAAGPGHYWGNVWVRRNAGARLWTLLRPGGAPAGFWKRIRHEAQALADAGTELRWYKRGELHKHYVQPPASSRRRRELAPPTIVADDVSELLEQPPTDVVAPASADALEPKLEPKSIEQLYSEIFERTIQCERPEGFNDLRNEVIAEHKAGTFDERTTRELLAHIEGNERDVREDLAQRERDARTPSKRAYVDEPPPAKRDPRKTPPKRTSAKGSRGRTSPARTSAKPRRPSSSPARTSAKAKRSSSSKRGRK